MANSRAVNLVGNYGESGQEANSNFMPPIEIKKASHY
jgi:hypothetical protein